MQIRLAAAITAGALLASIPQARAYTLVLTPATVAISPAQTFATITTPGVYHYVPPSTNAPTDATALFGIDPMISLSYSSNGGDAQILMTYQIALVPNAPPLTPPSILDPSVAVPIVVSDVVTAPGLADPYDGRADAQIRIVYNATTVLGMENCAGNVFSGCSYGGAFTTTPFASVTSVNLVPDIAYTVELRVDVAQSGSAMIDPLFTAPTGYTMAYSPGVLDLPEPASWAMMLMGLGGMGIVGRVGRVRRRLPHR